MKLHSGKRFSVKEDKAKVSCSIKLAAPAASGQAVFFV
jgi:hypothetical protein